MEKKILRKSLGFNGKALCLTQHPTKAEAAPCVTSQRAGDFCNLWTQ